MKKQLLQASIGILFLLPLYTFAEEASSSVPVVNKDATSTETVSSSTPETPKQNFTLCSQNAIEVRDTSIATSRSIYNTAMTNALKDRKNREKAAVAITDEAEKKDAIKASVNTYKNLVKSAQNNLTQARKIAWQTFEDDIKKCHDIEDAEQISKEETEAVAPETNTTSNVSSLKKADNREIKNEKEQRGTIFDVIRSLFN